MTDRLLTTEESARYLSLSKSGLQKHIRNGKIKPAGMTDPHSGRRHSPTYLFNIPDLDELRKILDPKKRKPNTPTEDEVTEYESTIHWSTKYRKPRPTKASPGATDEYVMLTCKCTRTCEILTYDFRRKGQPRLPLCGLCANSITRRRGSNHTDWTGGTKIDQAGYRLIHKCLLSDEELELFGCMFGVSNYIREHRIAMARHLGRPLEEWEHVHHLGEDKSNNDISNLALHNPRGHLRTHKEQLRQTLNSQRRAELLDEQNKRLVLLIGFLLNQRG